MSELVWVDKMQIPSFDEMNTDQRFYYLYNENINLKRQVLQLAAMVDTVENLLREKEKAA